MSKSDIIKRLNDIIGNKINSWTIIKPITNIILECKCECGNIKQVYIYDLLKNKSKMCVKCSNKFRGKTTHKMSKTRLYKIWKDMKARCNRKTTTGYENYGARGISVCNEWANDFIIFYNWSICNNYSDNLEIDRINVNGNYEPNNCRWSNQDIQHNNKRSNRLIFYKEKMYTLSQLAREYGFKPLVVLKRLNRGWTIEEAINLKLNTKLNARRI